MSLWSLCLMSFRFHFKLKWYVNLLSWAELNWKQNTYILNRDLIRKKHSFNAWVSFQHSVLFRASSKQTLSRRYSIRPHNNRFYNIRDNLAAIFNSCCCLGRNIHFSFWIVIVISFFYSKKKNKTKIKTYYRYSDFPIFVFKMNRPTTPEFDNLFRSKFLLLSHYMRSRYKVVATWINYMWFGQMCYLRLYQNEVI